MDLGTGGRDSRGFWSRLDLGIRQERQGARPARVDDPAAERRCADRGPHRRSGGPRGARCDDSPAKATRAGTRRPLGLDRRDEEQSGRLHHDRTSPPDSHAPGRGRGPHPVLHLRRGGTLLDPGRRTRARDRAGNLGTDRTDQAGQRLDPILEAVPGEPRTAQSGLGYHPVLRRPFHPRRGTDQAGHRRRQGQRYRSAPGRSADRCLYHRRVPRHPRHPTRHSDNDGPGWPLPPLRIAQGAWQPDPRDPRQGPALSRLGEGGHGHAGPRPRRPRHRAETWDRDRRQGDRQGDRQAPQGGRRIQQLPGQSAPGRRPGFRSGPGRDTEIGPRTMGASASSDFPAEASSPRPTAGRAISTWRVSA